MSQPRFRWLFVLFLFAFAVRLAYIRVEQAYLVLGMAEMERAGASLAEHGTMANVYADGTGPSAHVAPLYPLFLSVIYWIFGAHTWSGRLAQEVAASLISSFGIALLPVVSRRAKLAAGAGWLAAVLLAVLPLNLWVETSGAWEQPAAALLLMVIVATLTALRERQEGASALLLLVGVETGIAALLSPVLLPGIALALLAEFLMRVNRWRWALRSAPLVILPVALMITPWMVRNHHVLGGWVPLRSNFGLEMWIGNHPGANGRSFDLAWTNRDSFIYLNHPFTSRPERHHLEEVGELAYMREQQQRAFEWIAANPGEFARLCAVRFRLYWFPPADLWDPTASHVNGLKSAWYGLFAFGMFAELICLWWTRHVGRGVWTAAVLGPTLIYFVTHVDGRYRYPVFALSALLACAFLLRSLRGMARLVEAYRLRMTLAVSVRHPQPRHCDGEGT